MDNSRQSSLDRLRLPSEEARQYTNDVLNVSVCMEAPFRQSPISSRSQPPWMLSVLWPAETRLADAVSVMVPGSPPCNCTIVAYSAAQQSQSGRHGRQGER